MHDDSLVDAGGMIGSAKMWVMLRALPGLDLPDFLDGASMAYGTVTRLMYSQDWDALEPLVSPDMMKAMQATMDDMGADGRRVIDIEDEDAIEVKSARLRQVLFMEDPESEALDRQRCHLDVHIVSSERWRLMDYHSNQAMEPFDGRVNEQESTWRFEGVVGAASADGEDLEGSGWTVHAIV